jgi:hypothetical protein
VGTFPVCHVQYSSHHPRTCGAHERWHMWL